jgi:hypothetical protein
MKASFKINKMLAACVVALAAPTAFAQTISVSDTNGNINSTSTAAVTIDRAGQTVNGFVFELDYDTTRLSLGAQHVDPNTPHPRVTTVGTGAADFGCVENTVGTLRCVTGANVSSATYVVNVNFTTLANTGVATLTIDPAQSNFVNGGFADTPFTAVDNGSITLAAAPLDPTNIGFAPTTVNLANGGNIAGQQSAASVVAVTTIAGSGVDPGSYSCTQPAGFTLTNATANNIAAGSDPADISVTCTLAGAAFSANSTCTRNAGADTAVTLTLNCPAGAGPALSSTPANGATLTCNGAPTSVVTTSVTISNTGTAQMQGVTCGVTGAGFAIQTAPAATVNAGGSTSVVVACTAPAEGAPAITGTLDCTTTAPAGGALSFPLSSLGVTGPVSPTTQLTIPATSLWAKVGLIGLLAAVGVLLVGFRRQS